MNSMRMKEVQKMSKASKFREVVAASRVLTDCEVGAVAFKEDIADDLSDTKSKPHLLDSETGTPSTSSSEQVLKVADDRNNSIVSLSEKDLVIDVGLSTVPNQFCSCKDALELKRMLQYLQSTRGTSTLSSTSVMDMFMVGKVIGVGSYGKVRVAWHRLTGAKVAIKTYDKSKIKDESQLRRVHSEIKIMESLSHPRVSRMFEAIETPKRFHLVMECLEGNNLCAHVKEKKKLPEDKAKVIFFQLLQAVEYLHNLQIAHRDIKLENVLFTSTKEGCDDIKLIDFGFSTSAPPGKKLKVFCGTPSYMAPEIVRRTEYEGRPVDMWSLGVLLHALLFGCFPFRAKSYPELYRRIAKGTFSVPEDSISPQALDLMTQLLECDATRRITAGGALRHPWLQQEYAAAQNIRTLRTHTPILVSDRPADDLHPQPLKELAGFGFSRDEVTRLVVDREHSSLTTLYYLLLDTISKRRKKRPPTRATPVVLDMAATSRATLSPTIDKTPRPTSAKMGGIVKSTDQVSRAALATTNVNIHYTATSPLHPATPRHEDAGKRTALQTGTQAGALTNSTSASNLQLKAMRFGLLQRTPGPPSNSARGACRDETHMLLRTRPSTAGQLLTGRPLSDFM